MARDGFNKYYRPDPPPRPGRTRCLRCNRSFRSPDKCRIRLCDKCRLNEERIGRLGELLHRPTVDEPASDE